MRLHPDLPSRADRYTPPRVGTAREACLWLSERRGSSLASLAPKRALRLDDVFIEPESHEPIVRCPHLGWNLLRRLEALVRIDPNSLEVANHQLDHSTLWYVVRGIIFEVDFGCRGVPSHFRPLFHARGEGTSLHVWLGDDDTRSRIDSSAFQQRAREGDIFTGVRRSRLH